MAEENDIADSQTTRRLYDWCVQVFGKYYTNGQNQHNPKSGEEEQEDSKPVSPGKEINCLSVARGAVDGSPVGFVVTQVAVIHIWKQKKGKISWNPEVNKLQSGL